MVAKEGACEALSSFKTLPPAKVCPEIRPFESWIVVNFVDCAIYSLDEMLWRRVDMGQKKLFESVVHKILDRGVTLLRLARADVC